LIRLETKGIPEVKLANGLEACGPVHMGGDKSPRRRIVLLILDFLEDGEVKRLRQ
jgi:hypothetical protein